MAYYVYNRASIMTCEPFDDLREAADEMWNLILTYGYFIEDIAVVDEKGIDVDLSEILKSIPVLSKGMKP